MELEQLLNTAVRGGASDIILKTDRVPKFRHKGKLIPLQDGIKLELNLLEKWIKVMVPRHLQEDFDTTGDVDFSFESSSGTRFRGNAFRQSGKPALVLRVISSHIRTIEELQLPKICNKIAQLQRGLVLVCGATGSGKSTTLAAIIQKINTDRADHIITIEDPVEYSFTDAKSTVNQREVGIDTSSFKVAIRAALRQNPNVILLGELRDRETIEAALMAAETGHLVLSTLHTHDSVESLNRIISHFPQEKHNIIRMQLASTLQSVISQRLVNSADSRSMIPAFEILVVSQYIRSIILEGAKFDAIHDEIKKSGDSYGMISFDQYLFELLKKGAISKSEALKQASSPDSFKLLLSGVSS